LTSALDVGEWSASRPGRFIPREKVPLTHWIGGWVGSAFPIFSLSCTKQKAPNSMPIYVHICDFIFLMFVL